MADHQNGTAESVTEVWHALTNWLAAHAPVSHASLLPPATDDELAAVDAGLRDRLGYGLPVELAALWRLCGGVRHQVIEADEEGEVGSGAFLPGGVLFAPSEALGLRLPAEGGHDGWGGARVVPWLTRDEAGPLQGHYAGDIGVGRWNLVDEPVSEPAYPSATAYLEAVHRTLTEGPAGLMGSDVPGLVWGCLVWDDPENPGLDEAFEHWAPVH
ncbi:hypothetical protein ACFVAM_05395 [Streptomyces californicus]|uniref:hypothetical protein n=1 Tax=Streptomyces californicus TaxID=67351 RepID=UPI00367BE694